MKEPVSHVFSEVQETSLSEVNYFFLKHSKFCWKPEGVGHKSCLKS